MFADLTPIIAKGIIDNTRRGVIELSLWCVHDKEPLHLTLQGNCLQDIAGCRTNFTLSHAAAHPSISHRLKLYKILQKLRDTEECAITAGDITLSHRAAAADGSGKVVNRLSIEIFADCHVRLLVESGQFDYELTLPEWECSAACHAAQRMLNMIALRDHISANIDTYRGPAISCTGENMPPCRWDAILNRAEAHMAILSTVHEKYAFEPDALQTEAFVLDAPDLLSRMADAWENNRPFVWEEHPHGWEIVDFVEKGHAERVAKAMQHSLFELTMELSYIMQRYVISDLEHYRNNQEVEDMVAQLASIIPLVLSTILLSQDRQPPPGVAIARARELTARLEKLRFYHKHLLPKASDKYLNGVSALIAGLKHFVCTLHP